MLLTKRYRYNLFPRNYNYRRSEIYKTIVDNKLKYYDSFELSECNIVKNTNCGLAILSKYPITCIKRIYFLIQSYLKQQVLVIHTIHMIKDI